MKFKIWHLFVFLTLISVALASYISFSRTIFTREGVGTVRSAGHYTVGCDVIHDEMLDSFAHLGYSQVERPEWADAAKEEEYRDDGVFDPLGWIPEKESWILCQDRNARCYLRLKSDRMILTVTIVNIRNLYWHQTDEADKTVARKAQTVFSQTMQNVEKKYSTQH